MDESQGNLEQLLKDPSMILKMCQVGKNILSKQQLLTGVDSLLWENVAQQEVSSVQLRECLPSLIYLVRSIDSK